MLLAAAGAAYLGKWAEGALLLFLFSMGHALESYAMGRAKRAIEALTKLAPPTAIVNRNGQWTEVSVEELKVGERVSIKPNERVSADGFVVEGTSSVNQAPVTGESVPVDKRPVDNVEDASKKPDRSFVVSHQPVQVASRERFDKCERFFDRIKHRRNHANACRKSVSTLV